MKKWIITAAILLASVSVANAEWIQCELVQVLPGFFLPRCESYESYAYSNHYRDNYDRRGYERGVRHNRYGKNHNGHSRYYYGVKRHSHQDWDSYDRYYRRDNHRR